MPTLVAAPEAERVQRRRGTAGAQVQLVEVMRLTAWTSGFDGQGKA